MAEGIDWRAVDAALELALWGRKTTLPRHLSGTYDGMGLVIEAMMKRGAYWTSDQSTQSGARFRVGFGIDDDEDNFPEWFDGEADTLPQAVAVAALRAVAPERARELGL